MKKCILFLAMLLALCFMFTGCDNGSGSKGGDDPVPSPAAVESVSLNTESLVVKTGADVTLAATVLPENAADKSVRWSSDNPEVVIIDINGNVTGVTNGTAKITVITNDGDKTATCAVTVSNNVWTVSFDMQGCGTAVKGYVLKYGDGKATKPADPETEDYIFGGWYKEAECIHFWDFAADKVTADITLYARWISVPCKISFDGNGGTGTMDPVTLEKNDAYIFPAATFNGPSFTPETEGILGTHKLCKSWNTKADGTGRTYVPGVQMTVSEDITLYAQWEKPVFSVADGKAVFFSKGNMYWDGNNFDFETSQYDTTPASDGTWSENHVSHFYWSKTESVAYAKDYSDSYAAADDILFTNATKTTPRAGFTVSGVTGKYRVLSGAEFEYLLNRSGKTDGTARNQANRFAMAQVNDITGVLIFPDGYVLPSGYNKNGGEGMSEVNMQWGLVDRNIPTATWTAMESDGVVFLPATGIRNSNSVWMLEEEGRCCLSESGSSKNSAWCFTTGRMMPGELDSWFMRSEGCSIRLVCDYNEN